MITKEMIKGMIIGHAVGDALGVPVEFYTREMLKKNPVTGMRDNGQHNQPKGTWSDDTSMVLATMQSINCLQHMNYNDIMQNYHSWLSEGLFTAYGEAFDVGNTTRRALFNFESDPITIAMKGKPDALECGLLDINSNGNGSLMRMDPFVLYLLRNHEYLYEEDMEVIHNASKMTHAHPISQMTCGFYALIVDYIINEINSCKIKEYYDFDMVKERIVDDATDRAYAYYGEDRTFNEYLHEFCRLWPVYEMSEIFEDIVNGSGYAADTLVAAVGCLLSTHSFEEAVLKAVNLGGDTDTIAAITGSLAGLGYGYNSIPKEWITSLANLDYILDLCEEFSIVCAWEPDMSKEEIQYRRENYSEFGVYERDERMEGPF